MNLPVAQLRALSRISVPRALWAVAFNWLVITLAISFAVTFEPWWISVVAVIVIGSRQHALAVLAHDAVHYRFLPNRAANQWLGDLLVAWPIFLSVGAFRSIHGPHHQFTGEVGDSNRRAWRTHDANGTLSSEWTYPKSTLALVGTIARRASVFTGVFWIIRGLIAPFVLRRPPREIIARVVFFGAIAGLLTLAGGWSGALSLWVLPYCTWHMAAQYIRLICEHSGRIGEHADFARTRSTHPGPLGRFFVLPHHIGYHIEHHWFPSVPWYNLPGLYRVLRSDPEFSAHANVQRHVWASLRQCTR